MIASITSRLPACAGEVSGLELKGEERYTEARRQQLENGPELRNVN